MREPRLPLAPAEWACVALSVAIAHGFLVHEWFYPSAWDAVLYVDIARDIAEHGLLRDFHGSQMRTYGYAWLLSLVLRAAAAMGVSFVALLFAVQFLAYGAAALFFRHALAPAHPLAARFAFCGFVANWYALIYTPESLTESVSLTLVLVVAACWIRLWQRGLVAWPLFAGSVGAGFALMIRPANAFVVAAWVFGLAVLCARQRPPAGRTLLVAALAIASLAIPLAPQVGINAVYHGVATPFVTFELGNLQQRVGIVDIKYATAMPPVPRAPIHYKNPLYPGTSMSDDAPWTWYFDHPWRGLATIALHTFNLTDQDLLFTYSRDLVPWYRIPLGILNHAIVALGAVGLVLFGRRAWAAEDRRERDGLVVLLALLVANWAVYAWTGVEMRFGSVILLILFPFACYAAMHIGRNWERESVARALGGVSLYVVLALLLSGWVRDQAPAIRDVTAGSQLMPATSPR